MNFNSGDIIKLTYKPILASNYYSTHYIELISIEYPLRKKPTLIGKILYSTSRTTKRYGYTKQILRFNRYEKAEKSSVDDIMVEEI